MPPDTEHSTSMGRAIGEIFDALQQPGWIRLVDLALLASAILLFITQMTVLFFHLIFLLLTLDAFFWSLRAFAVRAVLWSTVATVAIVVAVMEGRTQPAELVEPPFLIGILIGVFMIARHRSQVQARLREKDWAFLQAVLENMEEAVIACDATGKLAFSNEAARRLHGLPGTSLPLEQWAEYYELYPPDSATPLSLHDIPLLRALRGARLRDQELLIRSNGDTTRHLTVSGNHMVDASGQTLGAVVVMHDITERKQAEETVTRTLQEKTNFIADVSHELRTPLTILQGNAEVGLSMESECAHGNVLTKIVQQSRRISRLVEDLLFLARSDSSTLPGDPQPASVETCLRDLVTLSDSLAQERGRSLQTAVDGEGWVRIDQGRIEQAVLIVVDNAAKYSPADGKITFNATTKSGELCIEIEDQGSGISEEELTLIFERFYRTQKAKAHKQDGTGLGLPIAKAIIEMHGGRIEAANCASGGTRISLCLPLIEPPQQTD